MDTNSAIASNHQIMTFSKNDNKKAGNQISGKMKKTLKRTNKSQNCFTAISVPAVR